MVAHALRRSSTIERERAPARATDRRSTSARRSAAAKPRRAHVLDLSLVGCLVRDRAALARGAVVDLRIELPDGPLRDEGARGRGVDRRRLAARPAGLPRRARVPGARRRRRARGCAPSSTRRRNGDGVRTRPLREASPRELRAAARRGGRATGTPSSAGTSPRSRAAVAGGIERGTPARPRGARGRARRRVLLLHGRPGARDRRLDLRGARAPRPRPRGGASSTRWSQDARGERGSGRVECQTLFCTAAGRRRALRGEAGFAGRAAPLHAARPARRAAAGRTPPLPAGVALRPLRREELHGGGGDRLPQPRGQRRRRAQPHLRDARDLPGVRRHARRALGLRAASTRTPRASPRARGARRAC